MNTTAPNIKPTHDRAEIIRACEAIFPPGQVTELRAIDAETRGDRWPKTVSGYFTDWAKLADTAMQIVAATGIYIIPNEVNPALLARAVNRARGIKREPTTSDTDITRRLWLLIDADAQRASGISSTNEEHAAAIEKANEVAGYLSGKGWPEPIKGDSGNGGHLMYRVDLPAEDDGLIERMLAALDAKFSDEKVKVDVTCANPARLWKLYGTVAGKGDNAAELGRPHRVARLLSIPAKLEVVS